MIELIEIKFSLDPSKIIESKPKGTRVQGFFNFGFKVKEFDEWISHLEESNTLFQGEVVADPVSNKRMVIVLDPDGNRIQLFEE